jgi:hypothetical protein
VDFSKGFGGKESRGRGSLEADAGMGDTELYENVLGLRQPWQVQAVQLDTLNKSVEVTVGHEPRTLWASAAGERLPVHDHLERRWRHLDPCGFATGKGQSSISLLTDLKGSRALEVMPDNDRAAADQLPASLPEPVHAAIEAVCIAMSGHFGAAVREGLPQAAVVHDGFHISAPLIDGVAAVHRQENRRLQKLGAEGLFGIAPDKLHQEQAVKFAELKASDLKSAQAWAIKEVFRRIWYYSYEGRARKFLQCWHGWASRSRLRPMIKVAKRLKRHFENIITYLSYPISSARHRRAQLQNPGAEIQCARFPLLCQLSRSHSLRLWKAGSTPTLNPEEAFLSQLQRGGGQVS